MSQHHDSHGGGGGGAPEWLDHHMSGLIMPFGSRFERVAERFMVLAVSGSFEKIARWYLALSTPIVLLLFLSHFITF